MNPTLSDNSTRLPGRRVSQRTQNLIQNPKQFFKRVYKGKNESPNPMKPSDPVSATEKVSVPPPPHSSLPGRESLMASLAQAYFAPISPSSIQFSAIVNLRIKKMKRRLKEKIVAIRACKFGGAQLSSVSSGGKLLSAINDVRQRRSAQAACRSRDYKGQFMGTDKNKSESLEDTTVALQSKSITAKESNFPDDSEHLNQLTLKVELFQECLSQIDEEDLSPVIHNNQTFNRTQSGAIEEQQSLVDLDELFASADSPTRALIAASFMDLPASSNDGHSIREDMQLEFFEGIAKHFDDFDHLLIDSELGIEEKAECLLAHNHQEISRLNHDTTKT